MIVKNCHEKIINFFIRMEKSPNSRIKLCIPILNTSFSYDLTNLPFEILNDPLLSQIIVPSQYKPSQNSTETLTTYDSIFKCYDFKPFTSIDLLNQLSQYTAKTFHEKEIILSFAFHQSISIFYNFDRTHDFSGCDYLIVILAKLHKTQYYKLIASIIAELFSILFENGSEETVTTIFPNLADFVIELQESSQDLIDVLVTSIEKYIKTNGYSFEGVLPQMLTLVQMIASEKAQFFQLNHFKILFDSIRPQISKLNDLGLVLLQRINVYLPKETQEQFVSDLLASIPKIIESGPPLAESFNLDIKPIELLKNQSTTMKFEDVKTFPNGLNLVRSIETKFNYTEIYKTSSYAQFSLAFEIIGSLPYELELFVPKFYKIVESKFGTPYYLEYVSYYVLLMSNVSENMDGNDFSIPKLILDPTTTTQNPKIMYTLRYLCVKTLLYQGSELLLKIIQAYLPYIPQFNEIICILIAEYKNLIRYIRRQPKFMPIIVGASRTLRDLDMLQNEDSQIVEDAREVLFIMFSTIFRDMTIFEMFIQNSIFISYFISLLFEESIQTFAIELLKSYFTLNYSEILVQQFQMIITQVAVNQYSSPQNIHLVTEILKMLNHTLNSFDQISSICPAVADLADKVEKTEFTLSLLKEIIKFYINSINSKSLLPKYISDLGKILKRLEINDQDIFNLLVAIAKGSGESDLTKLDIINPHAVCAMFDGFYGSDIDVIKIIYDSINFNKKNAIRLVEAHFDDHVLSYISANRETTDKQLIDLVFLLSSITSSPSAVQLYLSLLSPEDNRYIRKSSKHFIEPLKNMFQQTKQIPISYLYSSDKLRYSYNPNSMKSGVSILFWAYIPNHEQSDIFLVGDVTISIIDGYLVIKGQKINQQLPFEKWTFVCISIYENKLSVFIEGDQINMDLPTYSLKAGIFQVGGRGQTSLANILFCETLSYSKISFLRNKGVRELIEVPSSIYISPEQMLQLRPNQFSCLTNVLLRFFGIEIILPLFAQIDLKTRDGSETDLTAPYIVSVLQSALLIDTTQQMEFDQSNGVKLLSHLLMSLETRHLTYELYKSLYDLYNLLTVVTLKCSFVENILLNFDLWIPMDSDEHKKVLKHICETFHCNAQFYMEVLPFSKLINTMRTFYWYTWLELNQNGGTSDSKRQRPADFDTEGCRKLLSFLAKNMAGISFDEKDFLQLIICIMTLPDEAQQIDMINLTIQITQLHPSPIKDIKSIDRITCLLHGLINTATEHNISKVMELIILTHKLNSFCNVSLNDHLDVIYHHICLRTPTKSFLNILSGMVADYPEIFKITTYFAFLNDDLSLFAKLKPQQHFVTSPGWSIWTIWLAIKHKDVKLLNFLIQCDASQWIKIFSCIEIVCTIENLDCYEYLTMFLMEAINHCIEKSVNEKSTVDLMHLIYNFLFYHTKPSPNKALYVLLNKLKSHDSPHKSVMTDTANSEISENSSEYIAWANKAPKPVEQLLSLKLTPRHQLFSMRVTFDEKENAVWEDSEIALNALRIVKKYPNQDIIDRSIIIAGFLASVKPDEMKEWAKDVRVMIENSVYYTFFTTKLGSQIDFNYANSILNNLNTFIPLFGESYHKLIKANAARCERLAYDAFNHDLTHLIDSYMLEYCESAESYRRLRADNDKLWRTFWRNASVSGGPWSQEAKEVKWKRDPALQNFNCPFKLRPNLKFNNHMKASIARDEGNMNTAVEKTKLYEEELRRKYAENAPPVLLEVGDDKEYEENKPEVADNQTILHSFECEYITIKRVQQCKFNIHSTFANLITDEQKTRVFNFSDIRMLLWRRRFHHKTAIEIFMMNGRSYLLNFPSTTSQNVVNKIAVQGLPNATHIQRTDMPQYFKSLGYTEMWQKRQITNFDYLMKLNIFSGRTFNDPSQYPFIPWPVTEFSTQELDLKNKSIFRDLSLPIGCIGEERMIELKSRMQDMIQFGQSPFLFSSFAICPLSLYLWLLRMEPFTTMHIDMQSGKFDHASRLFSSIADTFKLVTSHMNDYRELIPEFFYLSSFLLNENEFDLGSTRGKQLGDVELPPWANNNVNEFIYKMRSALESDIVSENLNNWIDLFYGPKQKPYSESVAGTLYSPNTYESIWTKENLKDSAARASIEAAMCHIGTMPPQLFSQKHVKRNSRIPRSILTTQQSGVVMQGPISCAVLRVKERKCSAVLSGTKSVRSITVYINEQTGTLDIPRKFKFDHQIPDIKAITRDYVYLGNNGRVSILNRDGTWNEIDPAAFNGVSLASSSGGYHAFVTGYGCTLSVFGPSVKYTMPFYGERITCIDISREFGTIVCGTAKKNIVFVNFFEQAKINVVKIDFVPRFICIAPTLGHICAAGGSHFYVMDINGRKIGQCPKLGTVTSLHSYANEDGFDFFVAGCEDGKVYTSESYRAFQSCTVNRCGNKVIATAHSELPYSTICITENGSVHYFPSE